MKLLNAVEISVFAKPEEDAAAIKQALLSLVPFEVTKEKIKLEETTAIGFNARKIKIFTVTLKKEKHSNFFLKHLLANLSDAQKKTLFEQAETRLDENLDFFMRLDKFSLLNHVFELTDSGSCFHIKLLVAAFPRRKEAALQIVKKIFKRD
jgi:hypothetical protein